MEVAADAVVAALSGATTFPSLHAFRSEPATKSADGAAVDADAEAGVTAVGADGVATEAGAVVDAAVDADVVDGETVDGNKYPTPSIHRKPLKIRKQCRKNSKFWNTILTTKTTVFPHLVKFHM